MKSAEIARCYGGSGAGSSRGSTLDEVPEKRLLPPWFCSQVEGEIRSLKEAGLVEGSVCRPLPGLQRLWIPIPRTKVTSENL